MSLFGAHKSIPLQDCVDVALLAAHRSLASIIGSISASASNSTAATAATNQHTKSGPNNISHGNTNPSIDASVESSGRIVRDSTVVISATAGTVDIEGLAVDGEYLWVVGSHALARRNPRKTDSQGRRWRQLRQSSGGECQLFLQSHILAHAWKPGLHSGPVDCISQRMTI